MRALTLPAKPWAEDLCLRLLGVALAALALQEALSGHLGVSAGALYGRRPAFLPLLPPMAMGAVWLGQIAAGALITLDLKRRPALWAAAALCGLGLTQAYFNQAMFLFLTVLALALDSVPAARAQLLLLYAASAAFKLRDGFWTGDSLSALLEQVRDRGMSPVIALPASAARPLSIAALLLEIALPLALLRYPPEAVAAAIVLHAAFALGLPGLWPFTLTCAAAALLFLTPRPEGAPGGRGTSNPRRP